jgi:hypothetical protein
MHTISTYVRFAFLNALVCRYKEPGQLSRYSDGLASRGFDSRQVQDLFLLHSIHTHPTSYPMGNGGFFARVRWPGREADHSTPSGAEVLNIRAIPPLLPVSSWHDKKVKLSL